jgi:type I restriction enzyme M protein
LRPGGTAGIIFSNGILFGDTGSHVTVKERLLKEFDLQAVVILPKGMFEPYTPNQTCFFIFVNSGKPTKDVWFFKVDGDGSSLSKARKFNSQYRNDFPNLLRMWPRRETEEGRAWLVPAKKIIDNGYNMTLSGLGLIEAETVEHKEPEEILVSIATKEKRILQLIQEMRELLGGGNGE